MIAIASIASVGPMTPAFQTLAAVAVSRTIVPSFRIAPPTMNPIPVMSPSCRANRGLHSLASRFQGFSGPVSSGKNMALAREALRLAVAVAVPRSSADRHRFDGAPERDPPGRDAGGLNLIGKPAATGQSPRVRCLTFAAREYPIVEQVRVTRVQGGSCPTPSGSTLRASRAGGKIEYRRDFPPPPAIRLVRSVEL